MDRTCHQLFFEKVFGGPRNPLFYSVLTPKIFFKKVLKSRILRVVARDTLSRELSREPIRMQCFVYTKTATTTNLVDAF